MSHAQTVSSLIKFMFMNINGRNKQSHSSKCKTESVPQTSRVEGRSGLIPG